MTFGGSPVLEGYGKYANAATSSFPLPSLSFNLNITVVWSLDSISGTRTYSSSFSSTQLTWRLPLIYSSEPENLSHLLPAFSYMVPRPKSGHYYWSLCFARILQFNLNIYIYIYMLQLKVASAFGVIWSEGYCGGTFYINAYYYSFFW